MRAELTARPEIAMAMAAEDDWDGASEFKVCDAEWRYADTTEFLMMAEVGSSRWRIQLNDFPAEPLYTLFVDGREILDFNDWPPGWKERPNPFKPT